jgi:transposase
MDQCLDVDKQPHELHRTVGSDRGSKYACPVCGASCAAHDLREKAWRHLNFFQHHCYIHASVPRVKCAEHGVQLADVPWAHKGSAFTLLFEQAALTLAREMPVLSVTSGHGKATLEEFAAFVRTHKGQPEQILEVVCDMSGAFLSAVLKRGEADLNCCQAFMDSSGPTS